MVVLEVETFPVSTVCIHEGTTYIVNGYVKISIKLTSRGQCDMLETYITNIYNN
jgi:hypothetical protein